LLLSYHAFLGFVSKRQPAIALYLVKGLTMTARIQHVLRIDGVSHDLSYMTHALG